ncbi:MAG: bifunctional homocysteine S-methyltransferase/methylenetetrahydrofolate reductase [Eubacteriales bacterium]|nr:bifunctional homocysteine S-methyltransferase/methylenetetrahydrofolate reductase [Eubacteriales bacterium]
MNTLNILEYLAEQPLVFDGAMGTYLAEKYPQYREEICETLNLTHPEVVREVHRSYLDAGAVAIKTNTFGVNPYAMSFDSERVRQCITQGVRIARDAMEEAVDTHFLFADIGPVKLPDDSSAAQVYCQLADLFLEMDVQNFLFETMDAPDGLEEVSRYIKEQNPEAFIVISYGVSPEGFTRSGCYGRSLYQQTLQMDAVDAVGFNCISGPKHLLDMVRKLSVSNAGKYISIMPNAGYPTVIGNRTYFGENHHYFASTMYELAKLGVSLLGGCCGTGPEDIRAMKQSLQQPPVHGRSLRLVESMRQTMDTGVTDQTDPMNNSRNAFAMKLQAGKKVLVVELDPPVEPEIDFFMEGAARYQQAGVDAIDIADCPIAKARIDSSILACKVMREIGLTTIPHMTCRDRNINATKALLLGLNVEGVNNVLTVTGDPVPAAERGNVKTMFSYNSAVLANHIRTLDQQIFTKNPFLVSGALNVNAVQFDSQLIHAKRKIENGVSVLFTQPVLTRKALDNLKRAREELDVKILGGIMPVVSYRNACFMNSEMAGIDVDARIIEAYRDKSREEGEDLAWEISTRVAREISPYVDGYYLITPFKRVELILRIIESIRCI